MIYLLEIEYLNEACFLSLNTDDKKYRMCLKMVQDDLKELISREFYAEIETQYDNDTLTPDNDSLYEECLKDYLAWQTYFNYLKFANTEATPTGIRTFNDENSSIANDIQMFSLEKHVLAQANKYKFNIVNFLKEAQANTSTKYPLYKKCGEDMTSFSITAIGGCSNETIKINKSVIRNE